MKQLVSSAVDQNKMDVEMVVQVGTETSVISNDSNICWQAVPVRDREYISVT